MGPDEPVPDDPYMVARQQQLEQQSKTSLTMIDSRPLEDDKLKKFLEYDGKVLRYYNDTYICLFTN